MFVIEFGVNHLGQKKYLNQLINFFLNSSFYMATFMIHQKSYYDINPKHKISKKNFQIIINRFKKKKKKIGLSVCDSETFDYVKDLNFDFYKLLSISNTDRVLINQLKKKNKHIYISTGMSDDKKIKKCLKYFNNYKKKTLLHTPMTYNAKSLNLARINEFRKKFNINVGYSNHNNNFNTIYALSAYAPEALFIYTKPLIKNKFIFPDNQHAVKLDKLEEMKTNYIECLNSHKNDIKFIKKTKIFQKNAKK